MIESPDTPVRQSATPSSISVERTPRQSDRAENVGPAWLRLNEWSRLEIETTASRLAAVAHPLRLAIVCLLAQSERSVNEICEALWTSQPNISQHLGILHNRNLVSTRKEANRMIYSLSDDRLHALLPLICCVGKPPDQPA